MDEDAMGKIICGNKNIIKALFLIVFPLCLLVISVDSDAVTTESELFEEAYRYYLSYEPAKALELLDQFLREYPESSAKDAIFFWKAKSLLQLGKTNDARKIFSQLINEFPESYFRGLAEKEIAAIQDKDAGPIEKTQLQKKESFVSEEKSDEEQRLTVLLDKNENLQRELDELKNKYKEAEKALSERNSESIETTQLKKEYGEAVTQIKTLETRVAELSAVIEQVNEKQRDWKKLDSYIQELEQEKKGLEEQMKVRDQELSDYRASITELEDKIRMIETDRDKGGVDYAERIAQLTREKEKLEGRIRQRSGRIAVPKSDTAQKLRAELGELRREKTALESRRRTLRYSVLRQGSRIWNPG
jgi:predicted Zn-dependent protease